MLLVQATATAAESSGVPILWVLGAIGSTAIVLIGAFKAIWDWAKKKDQELVDAQNARVISAEERATKAEEREAVAQNQYSRLKGEFKATTSALRLARRQEEAIIVGHPLSVPPPKAEEEPTGRFFVDAAADRAWVEDREREKEYRRLNPDTPDGELDARLDRYTRDVDSPIPPKQPLPPRPGPQKR